MPFILTYGIAGRNLQSTINLNALNCIITESQRVPCRAECARHHKVLLVSETKMRVLHNEVNPAHGTRVISNSGRERGVYVWWFSLWWRDYMRNSVIVRRQLECKSLIEIAYYGCKSVLPQVCIHCGSTSGATLKEGEVLEELKRKHTSVRYESCFDTKFSWLLWASLFVSKVCRCCHIRGTRTLWNKL